MKKVPEANNPSSCQSYSRYARNLVGCWGSTDRLIGKDVVIAEPFDLVKLHEKHQLSTTHNHQIAFNFLLNTMTDNNLKRLVGYFASNISPKYTSCDHNFTDFRCRKVGTHW